MQIDSSIAMGVKPLQLENPMNQLANMMQIRAAQSQYDVGQQGIQDTNRLNSLYSGAMNPDGTIDRQKLLAGAAQQGLGSKIPGMQKGFYEADELQGKAKKQDLEILEGNLKIVKGWATQVRTPQDAAAYTKSIYVDPAIGKFFKQFGSLEEVMQKNADAFATDPRAWLAANAGVTADKLMEMMKGTRTNTDLGDASRGETTNYYGEVVPKLTTNTPINETANNISNNLRVTQEGALNRAVTVSVQNKTDERGKALLKLRDKELKLKESGSNKPLPAAALKLQLEAQSSADTSAGINESLTAVEKQITDGKLNFGPVSNLKNNALNYAGVSTEESRNFSSFKSRLEKLRNDSLRLNNGVQTDGDAQRAWNELFDNINDTELVLQRLAEIKVLNERAKNLKLMEVDTINRNYGRDSAPSQNSIFDEADAILNGG